MKQKRTVLDILGMEDCPELKEEVEEEIKRYELSKKKKLKNKRRCKPSMSGGSAVVNIEGGRLATQGISDNEGPG